MPQLLRITFGLLITGLLIGGPLAYASYHSHCYRNFRVVEEGVLYRSGQLNIAGLKRLIHDHGIKTVVSLRDGDKTSDIEEEKYLTGQTDVTFVRIPPRAWWATDGSIPAEIGLAEFRAVMDNPANYPVLVHCFAGVHRTGAFCAVRRIEHDGWTSAEAIQEMRNFGYTAEHMDVLPYLRNFQPHTAQGNRSAPSFQPVSRQKDPAP